MILEDLKNVIIDKLGPSYCCVVDKALLHNQCHYHNVVISLAIYHHISNQHKYICAINFYNDKLSIGTFNYNINMFDTNNIAYNDIIDIDDIIQLIKNL